MLPFPKGVEPENLGHFRVNPLDHIKLVYSIAKEFYVVGSFEFDDVILCGITGLLKACQRFDQTRGTKFSTYGTHWIRREIRTAFRNELRLIRVPLYLYQREKKIKKKEVNREKLAPAARRCLEAAEKVWEASFEEVVQDSGSYESCCTKHSIPDYRDDWELYQYEEDREALLKELKKLDAQERRIISLFYYQGKTLKQVAEVTGLTKSCVRVIKVKPSKNYGQELQRWELEI